MFDEELTLSLAHSLRTKRVILIKLKTRLQLEFSQALRLRMSTIGSSHKLVDSCIPEEDNLLSPLSRMNLDDESDDGISQSDTIIIFDEAGCIPDYELLVFFRIWSNILTNTSATI